MADLKPLGSEKLKGDDKIKRILEIAKWHEHIPESSNETAKSEYKISLADGNEYQIIREKSGYIIKKTISESSIDYIEPMENRKYYKSYSAALKRINLMAKEFNTLYDNDNGISLFHEQKYTLKNPNASSVPPVGNTGPESDPSSTPPPDAGGSAGSDMDVPALDDDGADAQGTGGVPGMEGGEDTGMGGAPGMEGEVTFRGIQKLTGKLSQKLRAFQEKEQIDPKDLKYVINSIISSIDLSKLSDEDKEEIASKFEPEEGDYGMEGDMNVDKDATMSEPQAPDEAQPGNEELGEQDGSLGKKYGDAVVSAAGKTMTNSLTKKHPLEGEMEESHYKGLDGILDGIFSESKVDKVISKYFKTDDKENKILSKKKSITLSEVERLSETVEQEMFSERLVNKYPNIKLIGKTNRSNLIFEHKKRQIKVSPEGKII